MKRWIIGFSQFQLKDYLNNILNNYEKNKIKLVNILNYDITDIVNFYKHVDKNNICIVENIDLFPSHFQYKLKELTDYYPIETIITTIYRDNPYIIKSIQYKFEKINLGVENNVKVFDKDYNKYVASMIQKRIQLYFNLTNTNDVKKIINSHNLSNDTISEILCVLNNNVLEKVVESILHENYVNIYKSIHHIYSYYGLSYTDIIECIISYVQHNTTLDEGLRYKLINCLINSIKDNFTHDNHINILKMAISLQKCSSPSASP
jgi:hypothetical protein